MGGASFTDVMTTAQNIAQAINNVASTYLRVQGASQTAAITAATLIKSSAGRIANVSVTTAGSAVGAIYDTTDITSTTRPIYVIPMTVGVFVVNLPTQYGLVVAPGTGQVVTVSWS